MRWSLYAGLRMLGPAGLAAPILARLSTAITASLQHSETAERLCGIGHEINGGAPQDMAVHLQRELDRWAELARHVHFAVAS